MVEETRRYFIVKDSSTARALLSRTLAMPKLTSWLGLFALGLPTLDGIILLSGERKALTAAEKFAADRGHEELLLRSDGGIEVWPYPRGGMLVQVTELADTLRPFFEAGRTIWLHEPVSPLSDLYSLNGLAWGPNEPLRVEVAGPGFDASDLKRGELTPHESFVLTRGDLTVREHSVVSASEYKESWQRRVLKVKEMLNQEGRYAPPLSPRSATAVPLDAASGSGAEVDGDHGALSSVTDTLQRLGKQRLLRSRSGYTPIDPLIVKEFAAELDSLGTRFEGIELPGEPLALSMSVVDEGDRVVYWDVVWPNLKAPRSG